MKQFVALLCLWLYCLAAGPVARAAESQCPDIPLKTIQELLANTLEQIQQVEYPTALSTLEEADLKLPCVQELVPPQVLSRLFVSRGLIMYYLGNLPLAENGFLRALAVEPGLRWEPKYGSRPRESFLDAREKSLGHSPIELLSPMLALGVQVFVDGRELTQGVRTTFPPGTHFLQIRWSDSHWDGSFFELVSGRELPLPVPRQALLEVVPPPQPAPIVTPKKVPGQETQPARMEPRSASEPSRPPSRVPFMVATGVASASLGSSIYFGIAWFTTRDKLLSGNYYQDVESDEKNRLLEQNLTASILAPISIGVTVVATGSAVLLYHLSTPRAEKQPTSLLVPWLSPSSAGLVFHHRF